MRTIFWRIIFFKEVSQYPVNGKLLYIVRFFQKRPLAHLI